MTDRAGLIKVMAMRLWLRRGHTAESFDALYATRRAPISQVSLDFADVMADAEGDLDALYASLAANGMRGPVPPDPTETMLDAARDWSIKKNGMGVGNDQATGCYQAMLAAAPDPFAPVVAS